MKQRVVIGYDGSPESEDALDLAVVLTEALEASLVIAAIEPRSRMRLGPATARRVPLDGVAEAERRVAKWVPGLEVTTLTHEAGDPAKGLGGICATEEASLLIIGSSTDHRPERIMLGTTGERLGRDSPCPLVITPGGYRHRSTKELRVIAVAFDGSHEARRALAAAIVLAERLAAGLRIFGVLEPVRLHGGFVPPVDIASSEPRFNRDALEEELHEVLEDLPEEIGGQRLVLEGGPVDALLETGERAADLLVVGSRPKGRLLGLMANSVSMGLSEAPPWPVVVVPARARLAPLMGECVAWPFDDAPPAQTKWAPPPFTRPRDKSRHR